MDCHTSPNTPVEDDFPDPHGDTATTLDYWVNRFSLTYYETTALLGAHGLGKCHLYGPLNLPTHNRTVVLIERCSGRCRRTRS